jgi:hypothetical protein
LPWRRDPWNRHHPSGPDLRGAGRAPETKAEAPADAARDARDQAPARPHCADIDPFDVWEWGRTGPAPPWRDEGTGRAVPEVFAGPTSSAA